MPVPARITDLSATASDNYPAGTDTVGPNLDDYLRGIQSVIRGDLATKGADIASATTADLGAVKGLFHDITGTTTITGFGTVAAGVWKVLKFEGALTLTHNATSLILLGGENITTADGDVCMVVSEGSGNWRMVGYWPAAVNPAKVVSTDESQTLTNKTISGSSNTLSNIGNSSLTNSSIAVAGHTVSLGGSTAIAAGDLSNGTTGSNAVVLATSPTLTTPNIGAATGSSLNLGSGALTAGATGVTTLSATGQIAGTAGLSFTGANDTNQTLFRYVGGSNNPGLFVKTVEASNYSSLFGSGSAGGTLWLGGAGTEGVVRVGSATVDIPSATLNVGTTNNSTSSQLFVEKAGYPATLKTTIAAYTALIAWNADTTGDNGFIAFTTEGTLTQRGSVVYNRGGGVVAYNTTSDYRAKDLFGEFTGSGAIIDRLTVYDGLMKGATIRRPMFVAHEAQAVVPFAVTGEKDAVDAEGNPIYQSMDHQILVPLLVAEIKSLRNQLRSAGITIH